jgi:hypothetical protein
MRGIPRGPWQGGKAPVASPVRHHIRHGSANARYGLVVGGVKILGGELVWVLVLVSLKLSGYPQRTVFHSGKFNFFLIS